MQTKTNQPPASRARTLVSQNWKTPLVTLAFVAVGIFVVSHHQDIQQRIETTNNILRRYKCPPGGYPAGRKDNGDCLCLKCPKGYHCPGGYRGRVPCPRGTYQSITGQNTCTKSPPGHFVPGQGASLPTQCAPGTYQPGSGHWACLPASPGNFVPLPRMINQVKCPIRQYQNQRGQLKCKLAPKGTFVAAVGQSRPTLCNYGMYNDLEGQIRCKKARPGRYVSGRGQSSDYPCRPNTFQLCHGQIRCLPCTPGLTGIKECQVKRSLIFGVGRFSGLGNSFQTSALVLGRPLMKKKKKKPKSSSSSGGNASS